ncbi:hypothetical protein GXW78_20695 [Roseomonas terrae]|uniref:Uncharacterized protein n=1 Tax=Neoroseomonas terrae TaxID=424799 RepID=A0ABS5EM58_9PROT|nr:hypothetical protein [Neoroseomonas terrae]MBR0652088.1 hypothetical protein [Neoroseomonas terrae]
MFMNTHRGAALWQAAELPLAGLTLVEAAVAMGVTPLVFGRVLRSRARLDRAAEHAALAVPTMRKRGGW